MRPKAFRINNKAVVNNVLVTQYSIETQRYDLNWMLESENDIYETEDEMFHVAKQLVAQGYVVYDYNGYALA